VTTQAFATVLTRVLALAPICQALFSLLDFGIRAWSLRNAQTGWTSYPPLQSAGGSSDLYLHDTYYVFSHNSLLLLAPALRLLLGVVLLITARRVGRALCAGLEAP